MVFGESLGVDCLLARWAERPGCVVARLKRYLTEPPPTFQ